MNNPNEQQGLLLEAMRTNNKIGYFMYCEEHRGIRPVEL